MAEIKAGDLYYRVHCQNRVEHDDGYGNTVAEFATQFTVRAAYRHLRGGETVMASRLENKHPVLITVRASSETRQINSDWRLVDARDDTAWAIRDVTAETDRQFVTFLCERGVAA
jgi:SPP1 family predicted phage head-tail adaptor